MFSKCSAKTGCFPTRFPMSPLPRLLGDLEACWLQGSKAQHLQIRPLRGRECCVGGSVPAGMREGGGTVNPRAAQPRAAKGAEVLAAKAIVNKPVYLRRPNWILILDRKSVV